MAHQFRDAGDQQRRSYTAPAPYFFVSRSRRSRSAARARRPTALLCGRTGMLGAPGATSSPTNSGHRDSGGQRCNADGASHCANHCLGVAHLLSEAGGKMYRPENKRTSNLSFQHLLKHVISTLGGGTPDIPDLRAQRPWSASIRCAPAPHAARNIFRPNPRNVFVMPLTVKHVNAEVIGSRWLDRSTVVKGVAR